MVLACFTCATFGPTMLWSQGVATTEATTENKDDQVNVVDMRKLKHPLQPALWKIEGKGIEKPSYLFGTVHHSDPRVTVLHPAAEEAFDQADHFYSELEKDTSQQMAAVMKLMRRDGKTLSESLGPELSKELKAVVLAVDPNYNVQQLQVLKTWVASLMIPGISKPDQNDVQPAGKSLDNVLHARAKKDGKKVGAMETADSQAAVFDQFTEQEQVQFVKAAVALLKRKKEETKPVKRIHELYLANDLVELAQRTSNEDENKELGSKELGERLVKALKTDRNIKMADKIEGLLTKTPDETHFFAVGVGHYIGDQSVTEMLVEKGYSVTPAFDSLDPKLEFKGYGVKTQSKEVKAKKSANKTEIGTSLADITWGTRLAGPKLQKTDMLENKVVLLVLWGS